MSTTMGDDSDNNGITILSDELKAELGENDDIVLSSRKKVHKKQEHVPEEYIETAKKMSKSAKKREIQIEQRQIKEV